MIKITSIKTRRPSAFNPKSRTMTRNDRSKSKRNSNDQDKQLRNSSRPSESQVQTRAIMRMTASIPRQEKIKETFKDEEGNDIKEYIDTYKEGDRKENLLVLEKQLLLLGTRYELYEEGKWKKLCRIGSRAMTGNCAETWREEVEEGIRNHNIGNAAAQKKKFEETIQKFNEIYLGEDVIDEQKTVMEEGKIEYAGHDIEKAIKRLYAINDTLPLLAKGATKFSDREMAKKIIPRNLSAKARAEFIVNGGDRMREKTDIMALSRRLEKLIDVKTEAAQEERQERHGRNQRNGGSRNNRSKATASTNQGEKADPAICRIHGNHKWSECPNNKANKANKTGASTSKATAQKRRGGKHRSSEERNAALTGRTLPGPGRDQ